MDWSSNPLFETAFALGRTHAEANPGGLALPPLLFLTDPERTPEPWVQAGRLPPRAGVIFRAFGRPDALAVGERLADLCRENSLFFLVGADADLAAALAADGVHLPERAVHEAPALRARRPAWLITGAAHSAQALDRAAEVGLDAALLSPVFASLSPSAERPLGAALFTEMARTARLPVYALGGVTARTAPDLLSSEACGLAAVGAV